MSAYLEYGDDGIWDNALVWWECKECKSRGTVYRRRLFDKNDAIETAKLELDIHNGMWHGA